MSKIAKERFEKLRGQRQEILAADRERGWKDGMRFVTKWGDYADIREFIDCTEEVDSVEDALYRNMRQWKAEVEDGLQNVTDLREYWLGFRDGATDVWNRLKPELGD